MLNVARAAELKRRGLRFVPAQVLKRSLRKLKHSIRLDNPPERNQDSRPTAQAEQPK